MFFKVKTQHITVNAFQGSQSFFEMIFQDFPRTF